MKKRGALPMLRQVSRASSRTVLVKWPVNERCTGLVRFGQPYTKENAARDEEDNNILVLLSCAALCMLRMEPKIYQPEQAG